MNMTRGSFIVSTCLALSLGAIQHAEAALSEAWTTQIGTRSGDVSNSVAVDATGNAYITGYTWGSLGGPNAGGIDAFLTKFDPTGAELWTTQLGGTSGDNSQSVAVDAAGNAYITGFTYGSFSGPSAGSYDAFLTKFDPSGAVLWSKQIGTTTFEYSYSVAVDAAGNPYISGETFGSLAGPGLGNTDAFLIKFDPSGDELWSTQFGTVDADTSYSLALDAAGNAYISRSSRPRLGGNYDVFLTKLDPSGTELWSEHIVKTAYNGSYYVAVDAAGNAYFTGSNQFSIAGPNAGGWDIFLIKFDPSGNELWATQAGTAKDDVSFSVAVDAAGNAYITGEINDTIDGAFADKTKAFLTKFDPSGAELWSMQIGTTENDRSNSVALDAAGNPYITGYTWGNLGGPRAGSSDAFLIKFTIPEPASLALLALGAPVLLRRKD